MSNLTRISGIASGMDTESLIKQMMSTKRAKADRYTQRKTKNGWLQEAYHKANKDIANFILDSRKKLGLTNYTYYGQLSTSSIDKAEWAKKAVVDKDDYFTAKATATATGEYDVKVKQLAKNATVKGHAVSDVKASDLVGGGDRTLSLEVNGKMKTVNIKGTDTIATAVKKIKEATGLNISFSKVGQTSDGKDTSALFMSSKKSGADQSIKSDDQGTLDFFSRLGVHTDNSDGSLKTGVKGQNSKIEVNGIEIENQSNEVSVNGLNLTLKKVSATVQKVSITTDTDAIFNKIKEFVDNYNKVVGDLQDKLKEKSYRDFQPLTEEQKKNMKEGDIKLWEEKAKSGLLKDSNTISSMISKIRSGLYESVKGSGSMYELGITTGSYKNGAKLEINESKLKEAIAKDPQKVLDTLFKAPEDISNYKIRSTDSAATVARKKVGLKAQREDTGVFVRMMGDMADGMESIAKEAGAGKDSSLLKDVRSNILAEIVSGKSAIEQDTRIIEKRLELENRRLNSYESALWKKFSDMEKAMQRLQSQSGWISQQFGGK
ncbi:MAG: flagellar filament capping protein FliD [Peptoanaerobacter stomatis]|uniref:flagellar filament capping protein FliD n=1 Tax=Peptoanaerobacter stomatis TaxID=796937 RepID=UPI003FA151E6